MSIWTGIPTILGILGFAAALLVILFGLGLAGYVVAIIRTELRCRHIPAPKRRSFLLGNATDFLEMRKKFGLSNTQLIYHWTRQLGPVVWIRILWRPHILAAAPELVKELLLDSRHKKPKRIYRLFHSVFGARYMGTGLVSETDHKNWFHRRAVMNPAFTRRYLKGLLNLFNEGAEDLCQHLLNKADGKTLVQMLDQFNNVTLDVIAKVSFSMVTGAISDSTCPFPAAVKKGLQGIQTVFDNPLAELDPRSESRRFRQSVRDALGFIRQTGASCVKERIEARRRGDHVPDDILNVILEASNDLEGDNEFQMINMLDEFVTLFFAGQETTSNLMAFTIQQLGRHSDVYERLQTEVDEVLGEKPFIEYEDLPNLEYMMRVLKETLRLYPPVPGTTRETVQPVKCRGCTIPAGLSVSVMTGVAGRMEEFFDDPLLFNPDRFKPPDDGEVPKHLYAYFPFSMGQRSCIGQQFALIEARVIIGKLLQRFRFRLNQCQRFWVLDELTAKPMDNTKTYLTLRL